MVLPILNKLKGEDSYQYYIVRKLHEELSLLKKHHINITSFIRLIEDYTNQEIFLYWENNLSLINNTDRVDDALLKKSIRESLSPVSYTHLDVYKRQDQGTDISRTHVPNQIILHRSVIFDNMADKRVASFFKHIVNLHEKR